MWHRTDNFRQGRVHPMCTSRVQDHVPGGQRAGVRPASHERRDRLQSRSRGAAVGDARERPEGDFLAYSQSIFALTANVPYNFGAVTQLLNEVYNDDVTFNTSSVRNIYSPEVTAAKELMVDQIAGVMRQDPYQFRRNFIRDSRMLAVLDAAAKAANWGRSMPAGTAQGIGAPPRVQGLRGVHSGDRLHPGHGQQAGAGRRHRAACDEGRLRRRRRVADQPPRSPSPDDGRDHGRDRAGR